MLGHLNVALLLRAQRSSIHKNCRIVWLMFDSILPGIIKRNTTSTYPRKRVLLVEKSDNQAKFGNCCSMVWTHRQGQWKGIFRGGSKEVTHCFTMYFFLSPRTTGC